MFHVKMDTRRMYKFLDDHSKNQVPHALSQTINKVLFNGKKGMEKDMDRVYDGGATPWTKGGVRYVKSSKQLPVGILYVEEDRAYVMRTIDGGLNAPKKEVLIKPMNIRVNRYGNLVKGAVAKRYNDDKFFAGKPYRGNAPNSARKNIKVSADDPQVGLWERKGKKGKRGGIARQALIMRVQFGNAEMRTGFFDARKMAKVRAQRDWRKILAQELVKAKIQAIQRGR
jgi:hypothetical protein